MGENAEIFDRLSRIEQTCARIDERTERHDKEHDDHEKRIRELEQENSKRKGAMAALSIFSSFIGGLIVWLFNALFKGGN